MSPILDPNREFINKWEMYKLLLRHSIKNVQIPVTKLFSRESYNQCLSNIPFFILSRLPHGAGEDQYH